MMKLNTLYFSPVTPDDNATLQARLSAYRTGLFDNVLDLALGDSLINLLGKRAPNLYQFIGEMQSYYDSAPEQFWKIVHHYAAPFMLSRMVTNDINDPVQLDHVAGNLHAILLVERLKGNVSHGGKVTYTTTTDHAGRIPALLDDSYLHLEGEPLANTFIKWDCEANRVTLRFPNGERPNITLALPLAPGGPVSFEPFTKLACLDMTIFDNPTVVGMKEGEAPADDRRYDDQEGWEPMPLTESMAQAYPIVKDLWPEALPWLKALVPAFIDMRGPQSRRVHRSASYGPGTPIFFTKVENPLLHAEDMIHELQHQRFFLFLENSDFGLWKDMRQIYVSPYRSDPRPLRGLHIGLHAFLTVVEFRIRALKRGLLNEQQIYDLIKLHRMNQFSYRTIVEHEQFSPAGKEFYASISQEIYEQHKVIESITTAKMNEAVDLTLERQVEFIGSQVEPLNAMPNYRFWNDTAQLAAAFA
jgi:hypothetical protein